MIRHVPKEDNRVADCLAKLSSEKMTGLQVYDECLHDASEILIQYKARRAIGQLNLM